MNTIHIIKDNVEVAKRETTNNSLIIPQIGSTIRFRKFYRTNGELGYKYIEGKVIDICYVYLYDDLESVDINIYVKETINKDLVTNGENS